jgi:tetratricopeptide (TPR) repeat protein
LTGRALYLQGKTAEALAVFDDILKRGVGAAVGGRAWLACAQVRAGQHDKARALLEQQLSTARGARVLAQTYACLGDAEHTLEYLEKSIAEHPAGLAEILQAPELKWMRPNPRFAMLRKKLNLAP